MSAIIGLLVIAYVLLLLEAVVPGGVLGVLGFICLAAAGWVAAGEHGFLIGGTVFVCGSIVGIALIFAELHWLSKSRAGSVFFLGKEVSGKSNPAIASEDIIGKSGEASTPLNPSGYVRIEGCEYEAFSQDGYLRKGTWLKVTGMDNFRLLVSKEQ
ncbi:MAG: NfeD family protein [Opitutales bacterium]